MTYYPTNVDSMRHGGHEFTNDAGLFLVVTHDSGGNYIIGAYADTHDDRVPAANPPAPYLPWEFDEENTVLFVTGIDTVAAYLIAIGVEPKNIPTEDAY